MTRDKRYGVDYTLGEPVQVSPEELGLDIEAADHEARRILDDISACIWVGLRCVRTGRQHLDAAHNGEPPA